MWCISSAVCLCVLLGRAYYVKSGLNIDRVNSLVHALVKILFTKIGKVCILLICDVDLSFRVWVGEDEGR